MIKNKSVWQWLCLLGILSAIFYILHIVIGEQINRANGYGYNVYAYKHVDFLTVVGAPARPVAGTLLFISRWLSAVCCTAVLMTLKDKVNNYIFYGLESLVAFRIVAAIQGLLLPTHVDEYGFLDDSHGTWIVWVFVLAPLALAHVVSIYVGAFEKDKSKRRLFPAVLLTVYIAVLIIAFTYEWFTWDRYITEHLFCVGAGIYILLLGLYGFAQKEVKA